MITNKIVNSWDNFEKMIGGLFITLASLIIVIEVFLRGLFETSIMGSDEIACFAVIWSVLFTTSLGIKKGIHVKIDLFYNLLPQGLQKYISIFNYFLIALFSVYLTYAGTLLVIESLQIGDKTIGALQIPMWIPQIIMPLGGLLIFFRSCGKVVRKIRDGIGGDEVAPEEKAAVI